MRWFQFFLLLTVAVPALLAEDGAAIYARHCASCHGDKGEGVPDEYDEPLQGERSIESLARYIDRNMPEDDPDVLDANQSRLVADYIMGAFYSPQARAKHAPPPRAFARLTQRQYRESVADLVGSFSKSWPPGKPTGLHAEYFASDGMNKKARKVLAREDAALSFDFGEGPPCDNTPADQFSIVWSGALLAPVTGWYEFKVITPNGARLYLNTIPREGDSNARDDSGARRQTATIDAWVSSGPEPREATARMFLLGGRAYPLRLDYFKYKEKRGAVRFEWKRPDGVWEVLAAPYVSPQSAPHVHVVSTAFPPEDLSMGFEQGTAVSRDWQQAVASAAVDTANRLVARADALAGTHANDPQRAGKLRGFLARFAERAFRRPLDDEIRRIHVEGPMGSAASPEDGVRRALILILQSPRFLYPELPRQHDDFTIATRLALGMWDSLPDRQLSEAAAKGVLRHPEHIERHARRMMEDPRAKAKLMEFFRGWLKLDLDAEIRKDPRLFPGFDAAIVADLRRSLELFVEQTVWNPGSDYRKLYLSDQLPLNDRLASFYQISLPAGSGFRNAAAGPARSAGVVTHPYLLARLAHADLTSPIHRGVFLTRNVLGGTLRPPPEAIPFDNQKFDPSLTTREKVARMTSSADCMSCHDTINPLGFALEGFDAAGRPRALDAGKPVDTRADYLGLEGQVVPLAGPADVAAHAATSPAARRGFIRQMFQSVTKQSPLTTRADATHRLDAFFVARDYHLIDLFLEINRLNAHAGIVSDPS